ncbi:MAG: nicotinate-nucleotide adenylyltransferase [Acidimicrobiia bacterium]
MRTGILGGTFDPIHIAHLHTAECALHQLGLGRVLIVPAGDPWQKSAREITLAPDRLEMCRLALDGVTGLEADDREITKEGPTYTVETLESFPDDEELFLILGSDAMAGIQTWHRWQDVVERVTIVEAPRLGFPEWDRSADVVHLDMGHLEISSTDIRRRVAEGLPYRFLVPVAVYEHIESKNLYAEPH